MTLAKFRNMCYTYTNPLQKALRIMLRKNHISSFLLAFRYAFHCGFVLRKTPYIFSIP